MIKDKRKELGKVMIVWRVMLALKKGIRKRRMIWRRRRRNSSDKNDWFTKCFVQKYAIISCKFCVFFYRQKINFLSRKFFWYLLLHFSLSWAYFLMSLNLITNSWKDLQRERMFDFHQRNRELKVLMKIDITVCLLISSKKCASGLKRVNSCLNGWKMTSILKRIKRKNQILPRELKIAMLVAMSKLLRKKTLRWWVGA